ncbi:DUF4129 domain-containing protein [Halobaculum rarum]|uniref:DUF4129 domain-containing protein n=1 Tax=Halobaculum rarum TaxID=3075122 RepID=UPI0032AF1677
MSRGRLGPVLITVLAVAALGVTATSLESTLTTDPDEEINPDWDRLPIGVDDAAAIKEEMGDGSGTDEADPEVGATDDAASDSGDSGDSGVPPESVADEGEPDASSAVDESAESTGGDGSGSGDAGGVSFESAAAPAPGEASLLDRLLLLLRSLLPVAALLALVAVAYRYRGALRSAFGSETDDATAEATPGSTWPGTTPSNVVDRAWVTAVQRVDPERPETTTTAECRALARERRGDVDGDAVDAIATAFERVHYAGRPVAEEEGRAREALRRLDGGEE